ncbi:hypothetical protein [Aestuariirhabdus sp. LZHN29]|uniref:hypothetical protein n=1 Tax=Aestuariirhabdus sp. LZHN29 TaxID=3417462 RepID=UPI003CF581A5
MRATGQRATLPVAVTFASLLLTACAAIAPLPSPEPQACGERLVQLHQQATQAGIADGQELALPPYPYLRANRTLWSLLGQLDNEHKRREWLDLSAELGAAALRSDHANLASRSDLRALERCLQQQAESLALVADWPATLAATPYPSSYRAELQALGLYPLTKYLMRLPLQSLHNELRARYEQGPQLTTRTYQPASPLSLDQDRVQRWMTSAYRESPLSLPRLSTERQTQLLNHYAPRWQIEQGGSFDRPGRPYWKEELAMVDSQNPVTYTQAGYTRWQGQWLLQLSYLVWFSERPSTAWGDIYAGRLDGLYLRVTLDTEGKPMLLDSIHPCGCYFSVIPLRDDLRLRPDAELGEPPLLLPPLAFAAGKRLQVSISSGDHMLIGAQWVDADLPGSPYLLQPQNSLRHLANGEGSRSLYSPPYALVHGTQRQEEILLWPSGIQAPGAMRQWGHHPIAFSAMRHFDDPDLLIQLFQPGEP